MEHSIQPLVQFQEFLKENEKVHIFSSHNYSPKELLIKSKKNQVNDTVFMSKKDFISIKNYIQKQIPLTTKVKGVPEMLIKSGNKSIFLVRLSKRIQLM